MIRLFVSEVLRFFPVQVMNGVHRKKALERYITEIVATGECIMIVEVVLNKTGHSIVLAVFREVSTRLLIVLHVTMVITIQISRVLMVKVKTEPTRIMENVVLN